MLKLVEPLQPTPNSIVTLKDKTCSKHILVVKLDEIGDMILLSPFIRELRRNEPHALITLIAKPQHLPLAETCPYIDNLIVFSPLKKPSQHHAIKFTINHIKALNVDLAIAPRYGIDEHFSRYVVAHSGAKQKVAYAPLAKECEQIDDLQSEGFDWIPRDKKAKHETLRNLDILRHLDLEVAAHHLEIWCTQNDFNRASSLIDGLTKVAGPTIAISPAARLTRKRWPSERFVRLSKLILEQLDARIILIGSKDDAELCNKIEQQVDGNVVSFAGTTNLRETATVLQRCQCLIGNDSAPIHIAAAAETPCIGLFRGDSTRWEPWGNQSICLHGRKDNAPWSGPYKHGQPFYLGAISIDQVFAETRQLFEQII